MSTTTSALVPEEPPDTGPKATGAVSPDPQHTRMMGHNTYVSLLMAPTPHRHSGRRCGGALFLDDLVVSRPHSRRPDLLPTHNALAARTF